MRRLCAALLPCLLLAATLADAAPTLEPAAQARQPEWWLLTGYGETHPGYGKTRQTVRTADLVLRRRVSLKNTGRNGFRGSHDLIAEASYSHLLEPENRPPILALNILAGWTLRRWDILHPYLFVGGGPVYTEAGIDGMGAKLNGNYQAGLGMTIRPGRRFAACVEYRFHHISNAGRRDPNDPLNASKVMIGLRFGAPRQTF